MKSKERGEDGAAARETEGFKGGGRKGFSDRIHDPAFKKYTRDSNRWSAYFAVGLAVIAVAGFTIAGEMRLEGMENPESLYIGLGVGGMFISIALFQIMGRKRSKTWDGVVADKKVREKQSRQKDSGGYVTVFHDTEYRVDIKDDRGKIHSRTTMNNDIEYNYFQIGDRVRHHGGLNSYEKYDKSGDSIIFCNACGSLWDITEDRCPRCGCPLLK